ncbi:hypothetical protein H2200_009463 [Cladophialophora chaetospira]|uniref:FAD-binding FR-type domain-containing protein n=1 Tax=Cladophialophora chaetospira TaxID=386627 RepID=A0AA39CFR7_9EURO|nr:hypothetical protein H2200_009463 [Cladophialophora chaetospira]
MPGFQEYGTGNSFSWFTPRKVNEKGSMSSFTAFWTVCCLLVQLIAATEHGTIGYGISMFRPFCCYACHDVLAMVYLNCTTFSESSHDDGMSMKLVKRMDMEMDGSTSDECYASNRPFLESFAYCVQSHCDAEGLSSEKQNSCFQSMAAGGLPVPSLEESLPQVAPTEELASDAIWLNETMRVNEASWSSDRGTIDEFEHSEVWHVRFSITIMCLCVGLPLLAGLYLWLIALLPPHLRQDGLVMWLQASFFLPAFLRKRHSQPLPFKLGYVPKRSTSTLITLYIILNIVFCSVPYRSVQPNSWYSDRNPEIAAYVANRTGVLSFANMALAILFSTRNNPLMYLSGWSQTTFLAFHRWAARVAILQAVVHSIVYTADYCYFKDGGNAYYAEAAQPYFWWGIIATAAMGLMAGLSVLPLRVWAYELFLVVHIILAILSLVGSWYHVDIRFSKNWGYEVWLYIAFAFWAWDRLVRLLKVAYYSIPSPPAAQVELVQGTNVVMLTIFPGRQWTPQPGLHTFVYFPSLKKFWENHPFTILDWGHSSSLTHAPPDSRTSMSDQTPDKDIVGKNSIQTATKAIEEHSQTSDEEDQDGRFYIRCLFRTHKSMTSKLHKAIVEDPTTGTIPALTEGPYGSLAAPTKALLRHSDKIICVAGGIGITFAAGFAKQFAQERLRPTTAGSHGALFPRTKQFVLAWTVREVELFEHVRDRVLPNLGEGGLDDGSLQYRFWITGGENTTDTSSASSQAGTPSSISKEKRPEVSSEADKLVHMESGHRMDVADMIASETAVGQNTRVTVLVCGPGGLADEVRYQVARRARQGVLIDLVEETFSW